MARRGGSLRIVAGSLRGRAVRIPTRVRPTTDRVRAAIFDSLQRVPPPRVLDCFAGSGGLGFEALSRGAGYVRFVERNARAAEIIRSNARDLDVHDGIEVVAANALTADLSVGGPYGLVLADPPYADDPWAELFSRLSEPSVLEPDGLVVAEYSSRRQAPPAPAGWSLWKTRTHGDVEFTVYRLDAPPA